MPFFTWAGNLEARVFGYMNGLSDSTSSLSSVRLPSSRSFRIEFSDLSWKGREERKEFSESEDEMIVLFNWVGHKYGMSNLNDKTSCSVIITLVNS